MESAESMANACQTKLYADACVQTSPMSPATRMSLVNNKPTDVRLKRVMYAGEDVVDTNSTPPERIKRVYPKSPAKPYLTFNGSPLAVGSYAQRRIVSLPEAATTSAELAHSILFYPRSVSMPSAIQHFAATLGSGDDSGLSGSFSIDEGDQSHQQLSAFWTPSSLPPTPESIKIIDNSICLPEMFLRSNDGTQTMKKYSDEG